MNLHQIRQLAGDSVFKKGTDLLEQDRVQALHSENSHDRITVTSDVQGTRRYQVTLTFADGSLLHHRCTCPAADYQPICKHQVATCLEYLDSLQDDVSGPGDNQNNAADNTSAKNSANTAPRKPAKKDTELEQIQQWLQQQPSAALIERLSRLASQHPELRSELAIQAALALSPPTPAALNKHITKALPKRTGLWEYRKVAQYFDRALLQLQPVIDHIANLPAETALNWSAKALQRLGSVLEQIDDSGGFREALEYTLGKAISRDVARLDWPQECKLTWLLNQQLDNSDLFPSVAELELSDGEKQAFYQQVRAEFDRIDVASDYRQRTRNQRLHNLAGLLTSRPAPTLSPRERLAIDEKTATTAWECLRLAEGCLNLDDELSAEDFLLRARSLPHDEHNRNRFDDVQQRIDLASGKAVSVWQQRWQNFQQSPGYKDWKILNALVEDYSLQASVPADWQAQADACLRQALTQPANSKPSWRMRAVTDDMVNFYLATSQPEQALAWVKQQPVSMTAMINTLKQPANYQQASDTVIALATSALNDRVAITHNQAYAEAVEALQQLQQGWGSDGDDGFRQLVRELEATNRRKTNFVAGLKRHFSDYLK